MTEGVFFTRILGASVPKMGHFQIFHTEMHIFFTRILRASVPKWWNFRTLSKGQFISIADMKVFIWTKKPMKIFLYYCHSLKNESIKKIVGSSSCQLVIIYHIHNTYLFFDLIHFRELGQKFKNIFIGIFGSNENFQTCFWDWLTFRVHIFLHQNVRGIP